MAQLKDKGVHANWDTIRRQLKRITTRLPKNKHRYLIHVCDQELTPFLEDGFAHLNLKYDPGATKTIKEYVEEPSSAVPKKPPDP